MIDIRLRWSSRHWVLPFLVTLLVLGHVCDLAAFVDIASSDATGESHRSNDGHHAGEQALSCEPATAIAGSEHPVVAAPLEISTRPRPHDPAAHRTIGRFFADPAKPPARQPLFLLHASLLI